MSTIKETNVRVEALELTLVAALERITTLEATIEKAETAKAERKANRDYGPKSKTKMTAELATQVAEALVADEAVKDIADRLELSRGQVYSLRGGYTWTKQSLAVEGFEIVRK